MPEANGRLPVGRRPPAERRLAFCLRQTHFHFHARGKWSVARRTEASGSGEVEATGSSEAEASGRTPTDLLPPANPFSLSCQRQMVDCPSDGGLGLRRGGGRSLIGFCTLHHLLQSHLPDRAAAQLGFCPITHLFRTPKFRYDLAALRLHLLAKGGAEC